MSDTAPVDTAPAAPEGAGDDKPQAPEKEAPNTGNIRDVRAGGNQPAESKDDDGTVRLSKDQYERLEKWVQERLDREETYKKDPWRALGDKDEEIDRLAIERVERIAQKRREQAEIDKDPTRKLEREFQEYKKATEEKLREFEKEKAAKTYAAQVDQAEAHISTVIDAVLEKLPESLRTNEARVAAIDEIMDALSAMEAGRRKNDITMEELVDRIQGRTRATGEAWLRSLPDEELIKMLPKGLQEKLGPVLQAPPPAGASRSSVKRDDKPRSLEDAAADAQRQIEEALRSGRAAW